MRWVRNGLQLLLIALWLWTAIDFNRGQAWSVTDLAIIRVGAIFYLLVFPGLLILRSVAALWARWARPATSADAVWIAALVFLWFLYLLPTQ